MLNRVPLCKIKIQVVSWNSISESQSKRWVNELIVSKPRRGRAGKSVRSSAERVDFSSTYYDNQLPQDITRERCFTWVRSRSPQYRGMVPVLAWSFVAGVSRCVTLCSRVGSREALVGVERIAIITGSCDETVFCGWWIPTHAPNQQSGDKVLEL